MSKCVSYVNSKLYFNIYIRFALEAYLELSLSSMIRFKNYRWENGNERFHSTFATIIYLGLLVFLCFSLFFLQTNFLTLNSESSRRRYGDLYLGLQTRERTALVFPFVFMMRRLIYAGILVYWSERNYFQIQTIIFKCSLIMIFTGYMRPFNRRLANNIELINDAFIVVCSYFLIIFSPLVSDAQTRYISGWPIIGLIGVLISINLSVITY